MSKVSSSQVITCKAAVCWGMDQPLTVEEIQVDPPKSSEIRVKMLYASLCHSDILCCQGFPIPLYPRVLGHEGVGVVESVGEGVKDLKEGDLVIPAILGECRECENCTSGKTNLCLKYPLIMNGLMPDGTSRMSVRGERLYHLLSCSTWTEYMVADANYVVKIDTRVHLPYASFLSCGFSTGFGSAWKEAAVEEGSSVAVIGLGAVGLGAVEGARMRGAAKIIGIDKNERKKEKGKAFGMTEFIKPDEFNGNKSISELIKEATGGRGVDYCIECTGVPSLINEALQATTAGKGKTLVVGSGNVATVHINFIALLSGGNLKGCVFGGLKVQSDLPFVFQKCIDKEFDLGELLTHEVALEAEDVNKALQLLEKSDCVKVLIKI